MNGRRLAAVALLLCAGTNLAHGQSFNARRTAMGGVLLPGGGAGSDPINVAYRAVPQRQGSSFEVPLPIGLVPLIVDPPVFDPKNPDFNVYDLANKFYNPPWNLQLKEPTAPSSDVVVSLGRDYLALQLGEIADVFPNDRSRFSTVGHLPAFGMGFRQFFANVSGVTYFENDLSLNGPLLGALKRGEPFRPNTEYDLNDDAEGQAALALQAGWAGAVAGGARAGSKVATDDERSGLYLGARARLMRGLAYGDAQNRVSFATGDTLFSNNPVTIDYLGNTRTALPTGGGWGQGFDLGAVWVGGGFEFGVGANDVGSQLRWKVEESVVRRDSVTGDVRSTVTARDVPLTSEIPPSYSVTASRSFGGTLVAADGVWSEYESSYHLGAERWVGPVALRAGGSLDAERIVQYACGVGFKLGRLGLDTGVATNSRNLSHDRGVELSLGLALYH